MLRGRGHLRVSGSGTKTPEVSGYPVIGVGLLPDSIQDHLGRAGVVFAAAWLGPFGLTPVWMTLAALVLCVPFFFVSVFMERAIVARMRRDLPQAAVRRWSWIANGTTYGLIVLGLAGEAIYLALRPA